MVTPARRVASYFPLMSEAGRYEIRVKGHLDNRWAAWFEASTLTHERDGTTVIRGEADQAALHGLLTKMRDVGLALVRVDLHTADRGPDIDP